MRTPYPQTKDRKIDPSLPQIICFGGTPWICVSPWNAVSKYVQQTLSSYILEIAPWSRVDYTRRTIFQTNYRETYLWKIKKKRQHEETKLLQCTESRHLILHRDVYSGFGVESRTLKWIGRTVRKACGRQLDLSKSVAQASQGITVPPSSSPRLPFALNCHNTDVKRKKKKLHFNFFLRFCLHACMEVFFFF